MKTACETHVKTDNSIDSLYVGHSSRSHCASVNQIDHKDVSLLPLFVHIVLPIPAHLQSSHHFG